MHADSIAEELSLGTFVLGDGARMPRIGFGTAGKTASTKVVSEALQAGLRLFDTAVMYRNEKVLGSALRSGGVGRDKLFMVSKAWPFSRDAGSDRSERAPVVSAAQLVAGVKAHIAALQIHYLDVLLLHWPTKSLIAHWDALIQLRRAGLVRSIGLSNANQQHVETLRQSGARVLPALIQTELAPVKADPRIQVDVETLVRYCAQHSIALMSHSPVKAALLNANALSLAARSNVTAPQLMLRYGLQRGFAMVFSSTSRAHIRANLGALMDFEIGADEMVDIACWRGEPSCRNLTSAVGTQGYRRRKNLAVRNYLPNDIWKRQRDACIPMATAEADPITLAVGQTIEERTIAELRAAPTMAVMPPGKKNALGSIGQFRRVLPPPSSSDNCYGKRCNFTLEVAHPLRPGYLELVKKLSTQAADTLADPGDSFRMFDAAHGASAAQHVVSVRQGPGHHDWRFAASLRAMLDHHIKPFLAQRVMTGSNITLKSYKVSRNANDFNPEVYGRSRSMLWHYDGSAEGNIKVILYLNDVDHLHGCMVAMRNNVSREPYLIHPPHPLKQIGGGNVFQALPALWLAELAREGYEPVCLEGRAGTLVIFDTNIVHRGSRPAPGLHRDFVLFEFCDPSHVRCVPLPVSVQLSTQWLCLGWPCAIVGQVCSALAVLALAMLTLAVLGRRYRMAALLPMCKEGTAVIGAAADDDVAACGEARGELNSS